MSDYKPEALKRDTKAFVASPYGTYLLDILEGMERGALSGVADISTPYTDRYAARYSIVKEIIDCIRQPLDDDTPSRG